MKTKIYLPAICVAAGLAASPVHAVELLLAPAVTLQAIFSPFQYATTTSSNFFEHKAQQSRELQATATDLDAYLNGGAEPSARLQQTVQNAQQALQAKGQTASFDAICLEMHTQLQEAGY
jgi:hypothetical protein